MLNPRILVVFADPPDAQVLLDMVLNALSHAKRPFSLRFAAPQRFAQEIAQTQLPQGTLAPGDMKFYDDTADLAGIPPILTDETHFLCLKGSYAFAEQWEAVLLSRFRKISVKRALLTAVITGEGESAQACLPAVSCFTGEACMRLGAGLALVCSAAPVKTLLVNPAFVMASLDFLRNADLAEDTLSIAAYIADYTVFALDQAPLWPLGRRARPMLVAKPGPEVLPPTALARYEQLAGVSFERRSATVRALQGLFNVEDGYTQQLPLRLTLGDKAQTLLRRSPPPMPLIVSAFIDQPEALKPPQLYMLRFSHLHALRHLPLTLYAGGEMERHLRSRFPNTLAYPDNALLPRTLLGEGMTPMQLMQRSKVLLLQRTLRSYPTFSHIAWLDIDIMPHPVCPDAMPDFSALMDDRVHLAWVNGEPDASLLVVPKRLLVLLGREVQAATQIDSDTRRSFSESALLKHLLEKYPDLFTLHPMPQRELLFFTGFPPELLSVPLRQSLTGLPKPIRVPPTAPPQKERLTYA